MTSTTLILNQQISEKGNLSYVRFQPEGTPLAPPSSNLNLKELSTNRIGFVKSQPEGELPTNRNPFEAQPERNPEPIFIEAQPPSHEDNHFCAKRGSEEERGGANEKEERGSE